MRYFVVTDASESEYAEHGYVYVEVPNIIPPKGYVVVQDEHRTYEHIEVMAEKNVMEITHEEFERLDCLLEAGYDTSEAVREMMAKRETKLRLLLDKRKQLVDSAIELLEEWHDANEFTEWQAKMLVHYPFGEDFAEVVAKLQNWGDDSEDEE